MARFKCWNCELWQGDESEPLEASRLCEPCKTAMETRAVPDATGEPYGQEE
jgi:hypothetical protein